MRPSAVSTTTRESWSSSVEAVIWSSPASCVIVLSAASSPGEDGWMSSSSEKNRNEMTIAATSRNSESLSFSRNRPAANSQSRTAMAALRAGVRRRVMAESSRFMSIHRPGPSP
jgi:hypothetical protein